MNKPCELCGARWHHLVSCKWRYEKKINYRKLPHNIDHTKLPEENDRRIKINQKDKAKIRQQFAMGNVTRATLAKEYKVTWHTIQMIVDLTLYEKSKARWRERVTRPYDPQEQKILRAYKMKVLNG